MNPPQWPRRIALVTPWFGNSNGGAEVLCKGLAHALMAVGRPVEVLTTCCKDPFHDWGENQLAAGETQIEGIPVRRFPVRKRDASLYVNYCRALEIEGGLSPSQEMELLGNSINSPALYDFITRSHGEYLFFFMPYLYGTTFFGIKAASRKHSFLIPCLHNEPFAYLTAMQSMFARVHGCLFLSEPERDFASALYDLTNKSIEVVGGGIARDLAGDAERFRSERKTHAPFALYVGRKVQGKGADMLVKYFGDYLALNPCDGMQLVMLGTGELPIPDDLKNRVMSIGAETSSQVYDAMAACEFLIHPSFYESFSIVIMEAWLHRKPVLVNGECEVTLFHALRSNGGLYFSSFGEFAECVSLLRKRPEVRASLGEAGREYVLANYTWQDTAARFQRYLMWLEAQEHKRLAENTRSRAPVPD